jgi:hypothetical protein
MTETEKWIVVMSETGRPPVAANPNGYTRETAEKIAGRPYVMPRRAVPARVTGGTPAN